MADKLKQDFELWKESVGIYSPLHIAYVAKKQDVFSKSNMINYRYLLAQMDHDCENVMYAPTATLCPTWLKSTMITNIVEENNASGSNTVNSTSNNTNNNNNNSNKKKLQLNNALCTYTIVISKSSLVEEYEQIMGKDFFKRQNRCAESLLKHLKTDKGNPLLASRKSYSMSESEETPKSDITSQLEDDEVLLLYVTKISLWTTLMKNNWFQFNQKIFYLDGRVDEGTDTRYPNQTNAHLPIPVKAMFYPKSPKEKESGSYLANNDDIIRHLVTHDRMSVTLDDTINLMSDQEFGKFMHQSNACDGKYNTEDTTLNQLGVQIKSRLENIIHKYPLNVNRHLKTPTAGAVIKDDECRLQTEQDNGLSTAFMIVGHMFSPMTSCNVMPPSQVDPPAWKKNKKGATAKVIINKPVKGLFSSVFLNHSCCGNSRLAGYFLTLLDLVTDADRRGLRVSCGDCGEDVYCFKALLSSCSPILYNVEEKQKNPYMNVGLLFATDINTAGSFAGTIRKDVDRNAQTTEFLKSLMNERIIKAYSNTMESTNVMENVNTRMTFKELVKTFCSNIVSLDAYLQGLKHGVTLPTYDETHGDKIEAQWGRTCKPEVQYTGLMTSMIDRSSIVRWLNAAVAKRGERVKGDEIFSVLTDGDSSRSYVTHVTPINSMTGEESIPLKNHTFIPIMKQINHEEDDDDSDNWTTIVNATTRETMLRLNKEKLAKVTEKAKYLMALLPKKDDISAYTINSYASTSKKQVGDGGESLVVATHNAVIVDKMIVLLRNVAAKNGIAAPNIKKMKLLKGMFTQLVQSSIVANLIYVNSAIDISTPFRFQSALVMATIMCYAGFKPDYNEIFKTKTVKWVHYCKPIGDIQSVADDCYVLYDDIGFYDASTTYTKDLVMYGRFAISSYPAAQGDSMIYAFSMTNYDLNADHFWYNVASKYTRHMRCKLIPGAIFAIAMSKPIKYERDDESVDICNKFISAIRQEDTYLGKVERMFVSTPEFNLKEKCRYLLGIPDNESKGQIAVLVDRIFDSKCDMLITNLEMEDIVDGPVMKEALRCIIKGSGIGDADYDSLLVKVSALDNEDDDDENGDLGADSNEYSLENLFGDENPFKPKSRLSNNPNGELIDEDTQDFTENVDMESEEDCVAGTKRKTTDNQTASSSKKFKLHAVM